MDAVKSVINSTTNPLGIFANVFMVYYAKGAVPSLPPSLAWIQTNYFAQVFLVGLMLYKSNVVGDNLQFAFIIAAVSIAALNVLNKQPALGDLQFGKFGLPGM